MKITRNTLGVTMAIAGAVLLIFAVIWWVVAVKRLVKYPTGVDLRVEATGTVQRLSGVHGLFSFSPPETKNTSIFRRIASMDEDYKPGTAVVAEEIYEGRDLPGNLILDEDNVYVFDRHDCTNLKSTLSTSSGRIVDRSGSWHVNFPLGTKKESHNVYNNDVASSFAVNYAGKSDIGGVETYLLKGSFDHRPMVSYRVRARNLPEVTTFGDLKDELLESGVPLERMIDMAYGTLTTEEKETLEDFPDDMRVGLDYTVSHEWEAEVEPVTGTIVNVTRDETRIFVQADVKTFLPLLEILAIHAEDPLVSRYLSQVDQQKLLEPAEVYRISSSWKTDSSEEMAEYARGRIGPIRAIKDYITVIMLVAGAVLLASGFVARRKRHSHPPSGGSGDAGETEHDPGRSGVGETFKIPEREERA